MFNNYITTPIVKIHQHIVHFLTFFWLGCTYHGKYLRLKLKSIASNK